MSGEDANKKNPFGGSGGLFGSGSTGSGPLFGNTGSSGTANSGNIFGGASNTTFGATSSNTKSNELPKFSFGTALGANQSQSPGTPSSNTAGSGLFGGGGGGGGSTTPASKPANTFSFPSTTPAGQPPSAPLFGASTGTSNTGSSSIQPTTFSFGKPATTTSAAPATTTASSATPSIFGGTQTSTGGIFSKPAENKPTGTTPNLFGTPSTTPTTQSGSSSLFTAPSIQAPSGLGFSFQPQATTSAPPSGGLFTAKPATATTNQPQSSGSTLFGQPPKKDDKPSESASKPEAPKPLFGAAPSSTPAATKQATNLFGQPPASTAASQPPASAGGFSFPSLSKTSEASQSGTPAPTSKPAFSFPSSAATSTAPNTTSTSAPTATTSAPAAPSNLFSSTPASISQPPASTAPATATATAAPAARASGLGTSTLGASTVGPAPPAQSRLKNKTMDEILTRWASDLTRYTKDFKQHAETIAKWDQIIVDNSSKIDKLYVKTRTCEKQTMSVEMQLNAVENQQNELESWLSKYENDVDEMLAKDGNVQPELGGPDQDRERTYKLAERLGERLDDMGRDLQSMVEEVNAANATLSKSSKADEPITQIVKILNSHLSQLQAIEQGTTHVQAKVAAAQKAAGGFGYLNGSGNGDGQVHVNDFYRSYMGRR